MYDKLGKVEEAINCCEEAILIGLDIIFFYPLKINLLARVRKEEALDLNDQLLVIYPENKEAYNTKVRLLSELNRKEEAVEVADKALSIYPDDLNIHCHKALLLYEMGKKEDAIYYCDSLMSWDPSYVKAYELKIKLLRDSKRTDDALRFVLTTISLFPETLSFCCTKSDILVELTMREEALECCNEMIDRDPKYLTAYLKKIDILFQLFRYEEELDCVQQVLDSELVAGESRDKLNGLKNELLQQISRKKYATRLKRGERHIYYFRVLCAIVVLKFLLFDRNLEWFVPGMFMVLLLVFDYRMLLPREMRSYLEKL